MQITANRIDEWAKTKVAQAELPRLVRRLIHAAGAIKQIAVPAGDSTGQPGWDGELFSEEGNAWVPKGDSKWEISCEAVPTRKANHDYEKRTSATPRTLRRRSTYVSVTARRWSAKAKWLEEKKASKQWADIRAYDADDLEQWLEQSQAVALQFAEYLGLSGHGIESITKHWASWSCQTDTPISADALFTSRQVLRDRLINDLLNRLKTDQREPYTLKADSVDEGTAFTCAAILTNPDLAVSSVVVTEVSGWRFVEKNLGIRIAVASRPEIAERPSQRSGLIVVIPYAAGDMAAHFFAGAAHRDSAELALERPDLHDFEKALVSIGLDYGDAERLAVGTGRSWSVFRRRHATNPAIRRPAWLDLPEARALSTLCLLGGWSAEHEADRQIVSQLAGRQYEEIERELRYLARLDDAPILEIGGVWKAKSALELLDLFGSRVTRDELDRFFATVEEILTAPDPQLELPEEERHAAQIHGKVRPQSELLVRSLCDTLIKLAVKGPQVPALVVQNIEGRVGALVRALLFDADAIRWLSLSSLLPSLAEAAPTEFLQSINRSLSKSEAPVTRLLLETSGSGFFGRCWHAGLLWALETLAWAPERLTHVSIILARLAHIPIKGNWMNAPLSSLVDIFRSWLPQTAANIDQRIATLGKLMEAEPEIGFGLLDRLANIGHDSASPNARPKWRDDDAGAGRGTTNNEIYLMVTAAADRMIKYSAGNPARLCRLIEKMRDFDPPRIKSTLDRIEFFANPSAADEDREKIRGALRHKIYWHRNFDESDDTTIEEKLGPIERLYKDLAPTDIVRRHAWLFQEGWLELPVRVRDEDYQARARLIEAERLAALREIFASERWGGIARLGELSSTGWQVGLALARIEWPRHELIEWIAHDVGDFDVRHVLSQTVAGILRALTTDAMLDVVNAVLQEGKRAGWNIDRVVRFLILAPEEGAVWDLVASLGTEIEKAYWRTCNANFFLRDNRSQLEFASSKLLEAKRPRIAFQVCRFDVAKIDAQLLAEILEHVLTDEETGGPQIEAYHVGEALERLEKSTDIERDRLVRLEFGFIAALGYEGNQGVRSLYNAVMSDPELFTELLCLLYKPAHADAAEPLSENMQAAATSAWRLLHNCRRQPGTLPDGEIDHKAFVRFIDEARALALDADRLEVCDSRLGQILAHSPRDAVGIWPFEPARDVLDRPELEEMRRGFQVGIFNKRGVTSRGYTEGGTQERDLAVTYRSHAQALHGSHPNVAEALEQIAKQYERDGAREDDEARLRREGH